MRSYIHRFIIDAKKYISCIIQFQFWYYGNGLVQFPFHRVGIFIPYWFPETELSSFHPHTEEYTQRVAFRLPDQLLIGYIKTPFVHLVFQPVWLRYFFKRTDINGIILYRVHVLPQLVED